MKILVCSDLHADRVTAGFRRAGDVERSVALTVEVARAQQVDYWMCLGDLTDPDSDGGTVRAIKLSMETARALNDVKIPNIWIPGNHDVIEDGTGNTTLSPLMVAGFPLTHVFELPSRFDLSSEVTLVALPFTARARAYDADEAVRLFAELAGPQGESPNRTWLFAGHLQVEGAVLGSETTDMPRGRDVAFPQEAVKLFPKRMCLNGHYHRRQTVGEVMIPGSLERLAFDETQNRPGFMFLEV